MGFNTDLLHAGVVREANGATLPPVYQSSAFEQDTAADLENQVGWHGTAPNDEQYAVAMEELEKAGEALCQK